MLKSPAVRVMLVALTLVAALAILRSQSRRLDRSGPEAGARGAGTVDSPREELTVGFLPVT
jgi:hypothetical protein